VKILPTPLHDLVLVETPVFCDERGSFQRLQCNDTFAARGLPSQFVQTNLSTNRQRHILRGMHFQRTPHQEDKLVRCVHGAVLDVVIDLRETSLTFGQHFMIELNSENVLALFVPKGFAHGYLTLSECTTVVYHVTHPHTPTAEAGIRWNDPYFSIKWPVKNPLLSEKDANWPDFAVDMTR
jgi:dTDP-4-dehydrorhamnose 3,5-epimerase